MGAIADAIAAYAEPLLDQTDGTMEQISKAFGLAQLCWNLAVLPEDGLEKALGEMRSSLGMDEAEFETFRRDVVAPMIRRHHEMFPRMHRSDSPGPASLPNSLSTSLRTETKFPGTARNAPCPCGSERKYKLCCGR
jgi:hypothetical protein